MINQWVSRFNCFNTLFVGFSGGLDSTVLLHALASYPNLLPKLVPVHINHGLSKHADYWQKQCERFCQKLGLSLIIQHVQFDRRANIEEEARIARYSFFSSLMTEHDCLILGHHLDDQAETVLLQLFRGAGVDGLGAMADISQFETGQLARPFLSYSRAQLAGYADMHQLTWIEDESNQDISYSRNYLRHQIMPLLKNKWPSVVGNIARTATHCQQAKRNLDVLAERDLSYVTDAKPLANNSLFIKPLQKLSFDRIANSLRFWLKDNKVQLPATVTFHRLIHEMIFAECDSTPVVSWGEVLVRRYQNYLYLDTKTMNNWPLCMEWSTFPLALTLKNTGINLITQKTSQGLVIPPGAKISVRFRQGGEKLVWHGQTKRLKKLFQEWSVPPWQREKIPLIYFGDTLASVVGHAVSDLFFSNESSEAWVVLISTQVNLQPNLP